MLLRLGRTPGQVDRVIQSWDTANKAGELNDYSVCTTWGEKGKHFYLLNVFRRRMNYPELKRAVWQQTTLFPVNTVLIEDKASGTQLIQEMINEGIRGVTRYEPPAGFDKIMRLHAQSAAFENGLVLLPENAHWLADYIHELTSFPSSKYDDQVDSTTQALAWMQYAPRNDGMIKYYEMLREEAENERLGIKKGTRTVRLQSPSKSSGCYVRSSSGHEYKSDASGIITVPESEAWQIIHMGWRRLP